MARVTLKLIGTVAELKTKKVEHNAAGRVIKIDDPEGVHNCSITFDGGKLDYVPVSKEMASTLEEDEQYEFELPGKFEVYKSGDFTNTVFQLKKKFLSVQPH